MASESIAASASATTLPLATNGQINIFVGGYLGWGFDINMTSTAAVGNLYIYTQYTNPTGDTFVSATPTAIPVSSGNFGTGVTRQTVDSNNVTTKGWVIVKWVGSDSSSGNISITGLVNIF